MGRIATSIEEQISILQSRGLILDCGEEKVKEHLLDIGYYRLGFYWHPFEKDNQHNFFSDTKFSSVVSLYYLDSDLRNILTRYINRIEINFRTKLVYLVSNKFLDSPTWFANPSYIKQAFISKFSQTYSEEFKKKNKAIKKHHEKYINDKFAPAWKTLEYLTFGAILQVYRNLKDEELKKEIANSFGVLNIKKFEQLIETVLFLRNASAHGNVLFDLKFPKGIPSLPMLSFEKETRHQLYSGIQVVSFLLMKISENRKKSFDDRIHKLFNDIEDQAIKDLILSKTGFNNFEKRLQVSK